MVIENFWKFWYDPVGVACIDNYAFGYKHLNPLGSIISSIQINIRLYIRFEISLKNPDTHHERIVSCDALFDY